MTPDAVRSNAKGIDRPAPAAIKQTAPPEPRTRDAQTEVRSGVFSQVRLRRLGLQLLGIGMFYVVVLVIFSVRVPNFLSSSNLQTILDGAALLGIVAVGQSVAIISGGFDLSVGGVVPLGAVIYGKLLNQMSVLPALLITLCVGAAVGVINGVVVSRFKINPLIATLAMLSVTGGFAYIVTNGQTLPLQNPDAGLWGDTSLFGLNNGTWAFLIIAVLVGLVLRFTVYGRALYVVGGNREAAELAGIRVNLVSVSVYVVCGMCAAFGGIVAASQLLAAAPSVGTDTDLNSVAAVILGGAALTGGIGTITGSVLGVLLLGTIANGLGLLQIASFYQTVITGGVLLLAVAFGRLRDVLATR